MKSFKDILQEAKIYMGWKYSTQDLANMMSGKELAPRTFLRRSRERSSDIDLSNPNNPITGPLKKKAKIKTKGWDPKDKDQNSMEWDPGDIQERTLKRLAAIALGGALAIPTAKYVATAARGAFEKSSANITPAVATPIVRPIVNPAEKAISIIPEHFQNENLRRLYAGFVNAEHRGSPSVGSSADQFQYHPSLYIRNKHSKASSAYGPVQLTRNTLDDHFKRNPEFFKGQEEYVGKFLNQGTTMLHSDRMHPTHGLGGVGTLSGEEYHQAYQKVAVGVMKSMAQDIKVDLDKPLSAADHSRMIRRWRGVGEDADREYFKVHRRAYGEAK